ncbi:MAG: DMT family transporter [Rhizobiaceae bacterium]|nr:DMT family transporter [Rhizobiaceae bacterium]
MYRNAYVLLLLTTLFWGGNAVAGKLAVGHVSPMLLTCARWTGACLLLWLIGRRRLADDMATVRAAFPMLAGLGFIGFTIFNVALYAALVHTTAINVSIEQGGIPMLIFLLNFLWFRITVTTLQIAGLIMSIVGVALTASHGNLARLLELDVNLGDAIMLAALVAYSIYTVMLRRKPALHWQSLMIVLTAVGALTSLPFALGEMLLGAVIWPDARGWVILAYVVVFPSVLAQIFYIRGVELIGANRAGLFINLVPIFGTLLSLAILGEAFHAYHAAALALVLGGIALSELSSRRRTI